MIVFTDKNAREVRLRCTTPNGYDNRAEEIMLELLSKVPAEEFVKLPERVDHV